MTMRETLVLWSARVAFFALLATFVAARLHL